VVVVDVVVVVVGAAASSDDVRLTAVTAHPASRTTAVTPAMILPRGVARRAPSRDPNPAGVGSPVTGRESGAAGGAGANHRPPRLAVHTAIVRLFVAVAPPADALAAVARLDRPDVPGVRWTTADQWHVTLRFLGEVEDPGPVAAALDDAPLVPTTASLGPRVAALGRGVLMVPVAGLDALAEAVVSATAGVGQPPGDRPFQGHLTLARARRGASVRGLAGAAVAATFPVEEVRLVRSRLGPGGARYEDVHVRPLDDFPRGP
jgi:RNA 2',3'-cyclic 3'-phosphodiesterase